MQQKTRSRRAGIGYDISSYMGNDMRPGTTKNQMRQNPKKHVGFIVEKNPSQPTINVRSPVPGSQDDSENLEEIREIDS